MKYYGVHHVSGPELGNGISASLKVTAGRDYKY